MSKLASRLAELKNDYRRCHRHSLLMMVTCMFVILFIMATAAYKSPMIILLPALVISIGTANFHCNFVRKQLIDVLQDLVDETEPRGSAGMPAS